VTLARLRTAASAAVLAGALALAPAAAQAKPAGAKCAKGTAKQKKSCAKGHAKPTTKSQSRTAPAPSGTTTTTRSAADPAATGPIATTGHLTNPAQQCRAEQHADAPGFTRAYGTGPKGANAFGRCVAQKAAAQGDPFGGDAAAAAPATD
jgi:hypothetical protein